MSYGVQLDSIFKKLTEMSEFLGGDKGKKKRGATEFEMLKNQFLQKRHEVEKALDLKQDTSTPPQDIGRLTFQIRQGLNKMTQLIESMESDLTRRTKKKVQAPLLKKTSNEILEKQRKILENCKLLLEDCSNRNSGFSNRQQQKVQTLTDMRMKLLKEIELTDNQLNNMASTEQFMDPDEEQLEAMEQFQKKDKELDGKLDEIIDGIGRVHQHAKNINQQNDVIKQKIEKNKKAVTKVSEKVQSENQKLKDIIKKFKPNNCCLWIVFFLVLAGLIVVIINMIRKR